MNYCNCLPSYNYTQDGNTFIVNNGSCIRTNASELPWCFVIEDTCITPVLHRDGLGRNDSAWDTCLTTSEPLLMRSVLTVWKNDIAVLLHILHKWYKTQFGPSKAS